MIHVFIFVRCVDTPKVVMPHILLDQKKKKLFYLSIEEESYFAYFERLSSDTDNSILYETRPFATEK